LSVLYHTRSTSNPGKDSPTPAFPGHPAWGVQLQYEHLKYQNAGHTLSETLMMVELEGNRSARIGLTKRMLAFLALKPDNFMNTGSRVFD
jgi:hypothetical protein